MDQRDEEQGRRFRQAWIDGVREYYPGEPKPGYIVPWEQMPRWEQDAAAAVYQQVREFVEISAGSTRMLTAEQKGRFICVCWIAQMYRHLGDHPKPGYVADWADLPPWQQQTDTAIFSHIEDYHSNRTGA